MNEGLHKALPLALIMDALDFASHAHRDQRRKGADVADCPHDARDEDAAEQEAAEIGGSHEADGCWREAFLCPAQRDQRALQAIAAEQDACSDEKGDQRADRRHMRGENPLAGFLIGPSRAGFPAQYRQ